MTTPAVDFCSISRSFRKTQALDDFNLSVEPGTIVGLIGRNGAGKTTALRLALGDLHPDSGRVRVLGLDPVNDPIAVRERVSLLTEESTLYPWMRVDEILLFAAGIHPRWDAQLANDLGKRLGVEYGKKIRTLSRGNRAKVSLLLAAACRPDVLLLDDPTAGLDPLVRREVLEGILDTIHSEGGAVLYASHLIHDIERIADRVVVLDDGKTALEGTVDDLKERFQRVTAVFENDVPDLPPFEGQLRQRRKGRVLHLVADATQETLRTTLIEAGARAVDFEKITLEEILVATLGEDVVSTSQTTLPDEKNTQEENTHV